jgi:hypothetical protein
MAASSGLSAAALSTSSPSRAGVPPAPRARQISVGGLWGKHGRGPLVPRVARHLHLPGLLLPGNSTSNRSPRLHSDRQQGRSPEVRPSRLLPPPSLLSLSPILPPTLSLSTGSDDAEVAHNGVLARTNCYLGSNPCVDCWTMRNCRMWGCFFCSS